MDFKLFKNFKKFVSCLKLFRLSVLKLNRFVLLDFFIIRNIRNDNVRDVKEN